eukprot:tig00000852_g5032.t1
MADARERERASPSGVPEAESDDPVQEADLQCPICFQLLTDAFITSCGHSYCFSCISRHLSQRSDCPTCGRAPLTKDNVFPNFALNKLLAKATSAKKRAAGSAVALLQEQILSQKTWSLSDLDALLGALVEKKRKLETSEAEAELDVLMFFLQQSRAQKFQHVAQLTRELERLERDMQEVEVRRRALGPEPGTGPGPNPRPARPDSGPAPARPALALAPGATAAPSAALSSFSSSSSSSSYLPPILAGSGGAALEGATPSLAPAGAPSSALSAGPSPPALVGPPPEAPLPSSALAPRRSLPRTRGGPIAGALGRLRAGGREGGGAGAGRGGGRGGGGGGGEEAAGGGALRGPRGLLLRRPAPGPAPSRAPPPPPRLPGAPGGAGAGMFGGGALQSFVEDLEKFSRFSRFNVLATVRHADLFHASNIVSSIEFDRDEEIFATAGVAKKIRLFSYAALLAEPAEQHFPLREIPARSKLSCLSWSGFAKGQLASSDYEGIVTVWDAETGQAVLELDEHEKRAWSVDFSRVEPTRLVSGSDDGKVKVWSTTQEASVATIESTANVCCVKFNPESGHHIAFGSADHHVYYYDLRHTREALGVCKGHRKAVSYVKFLSPDSIVSASTDSTLKIWSLAGSQAPSRSPGAGGGAGAPVVDCARTLTGHANTKNFVGLSASADYVACGSEANALYVYYRNVAAPILCHRFGSASGPAGGGGGAVEEGPLGPGPGPGAGGPGEEDPGLFVSSVCWRRAPNANVLLAANSVGTIKVLEMAP